ncbi:MAG: GNAT family N-acetyltransferase [Bacillota bacterium]|nr:GNAT family N-acetyltransferase [Bacillota bacterium]
MIRKATENDIKAIAAIYEDIHTEEEKGALCIGWQRGIYPTESTAADSVAKGDMFVCERDGQVVAAAKINKEQVDVYADGAWEFPASDEEIMVLHTLVVSPKAMREGIGKEFVKFYEDHALACGCPYLRMDTNERNKRARTFYENTGYKEIGVVPCVFNGIDGVNLVLLEKHLK